MLNDNKRATVKNICAFYWDMAAKKIERIENGSPFSKIHQAFLNKRKRGNTRKVGKKNATIC